MNFGEFFYLRKSDRKVILTLLCVILVALLVIFLTGNEQDSNGLTAVDSIANDSAVRYPRRSGYHRVDTIYLKPRYITSGSQRKAYRRDVQQATSADTFITYQPRHKIREGEYVVLNTADTTALMTIPGIGSYYARRIVQYGERLGGYASTAQLDEIDDLPDGIKQYLTVVDPNPRKLNVNQLSLNELRRHPYISFYQAKAITDYRRLHGPIKSLQDLRLSRDFPQEAIDRLLPYVSCNYSAITI